MIAQITSEQLAHNVYGDSATRDLVVYLPPGYGQSEKHYPTLYLLHVFFSTLAPATNTTCTTVIGS